MNKLRKIWATFIASGDDFAKSPYGAGANQLGHIALGAIAALAVCVALYLFSGTMPVRWMVAAGVVLAYSLLIEVFVQEWNGRDSLADTFFFTIGVATALLPVKQTDIVIENGVNIDFSPATLGICLAFGATCLLAYIWRRL